MHLYERERVLVWKNSQLPGQKKILKVHGMRSALLRTTQTLQQEDKISEKTNDFKKNPVKIFIQWISQTVNLHWVLFIKMLK